MSGTNLPKWQQSTEETSRWWFRPHRWADGDTLISALHDVISHLQCSNESVFNDYRTLNSSWSLGPHDEPLVFWLFLHTSCDGFATNWLQEGVHTEVREAASPAQVQVLHRRCTGPGPAQTTAGGSLNVPPNGSWNWLWTLFITPQT